MYYNSLFFVCDPNGGAAGTFARRPALQGVCGGGHVCNALSRETSLKPAKTAKAKQAKKKDSGVFFVCELRTPRNSAGEGGHFASFTEATLQRKKKGQVQQKAQKQVQGKFAMVKRKEEKDCGDFNQGTNGGGAQTTQCKTQSCCGSNRGLLTTKDKR